MKALDIIKEEISPVEDKPWIAQFFPEKILGELAKGRWYADCIYTKKAGEIKLIRGSLIPYSEQKREPFVDYIRKHNPQSFKEILFYLEIVIFYMHLLYA